MKKISLLPSLITTGNLFCGAYAIILVFNGNILAGAWFILAALFFDFLDGQVARLKHMATKFGLEYDSLADLVSFGLAPATICYFTFLKDMGRMGIALFFIYIVCTALRLARFNTQKIPQQKINFVGLPTPASSGFIASVFILHHEYPYDIFIHIMPILILILSALMVSTIRFPAMGILNLWKKKPFLNLVAIILCGTMVFLHLELSLFLCFMGYILFGIVGLKWKIMQSMEKQITERSEHEIV